MVNHRPRSSVLREKYSGTPLAEYFITTEPEVRPEVLNLPTEMPSVSGSQHFHRYTWTCVFPKDD